MLSIIRNDNTYYYNKQGMIKLKLKEIKLFSNATLGMKRLMKNLFLIRI